MNWQVTNGSRKLTTTNCGSGPSQRPFRRIKRPATIAAAAAATLISFSLLGRATAPQLPASTWTPTADMSVARAGASAVLLDDGRVLVTGGIADSGVTASAERFSATGGRFLDTPSMQTARANHSSTLLPDGRVLVAGGAGADGRAMASAEIYDPANNMWMAAPSLNVARRGHTATLLSDGTVLIAGGDDAGVASGSLEVFDPGAMSFTYAGSLKTARTLHAAAALGDGRVLIAGGFDGQDPLASTSVYDPETMSATDGPDLSTPRSGLSATTLLEGKVLIVGGAGSTGELSSAELFDPQTNTFAPIGNLAAPRQNHLAFLLPHNNNVLIVGGTANSTPVATAEMYVPWEGPSGSFCSDAVCASGYAGPASPSVARTWPTGSALSFAASDNIRTGPTDGLLLLAGGTGAKSAELYGFATVRTDKADYKPGNEVTIRGGGWRPGEWVALLLRESPVYDEHPLLAVQADQNGDIVSTEFVPDEHDLNVRFYLTAFGQESQAQTTFMDSIAADGSPTTAGSTSGSLTIGRPGSSTPSGELLIAHIVVRSVGSSAVCPPGPEWTSILRTDNNGTNAITEQTFSKITTASEPQNYTWTFRSGDCSGSIVAKVSSGAIVRYSGVDITSQITAAGTASSSDSTLLTAPDVQATANALVLRFFGTSANTSSWTSNGQRLYVSNSSSGGTRSIAGYFVNQPSAGPTGTYTVTAGTTAGTWVAQTLVLKNDVPTVLAFNSLPVSGGVGQCLGPITIQSRGPSGAAAPVTSNTTVNLSTDGPGGFYSASGCGTPASSATIASGGSSVSVYYRATGVGANAGLHTLTATGSGLTSANQAETIYSTDLVFTTTARSGGVGQCLGPMTVQTRVNGSAVILGTVTTVGLSSNSTGSFFGDNGCTTAANVTIPGTSSSSGNFYYKASAVDSGSHVVTASAANLTSATQTETIVATSLVFSTSALSGGVNQCLGPITIQPRVNGSAATIASTSISLTTDGSGTFYSNSSCATVTSAVVLTSSTTFYYKATAVGPTGLHTLTAAASGLTSGSQVEHIYPITLAFTTAPLSGGVGDCIGPITVQTQANGQPAPLANSTTLNLSTDSVGAFSATNTCGSGVVTSVAISSGQSSTSFYYEASAFGTLSHKLTASASGLSSINQTETILPYSSHGTADATGSNFILHAPPVAAGDVLIAQLTVSALGAGELLCPEAGSGWGSYLRSDNIATGKNGSTPLISQEVFYLIPGSAQDERDYTWSFKAGNCVSGSPVAHGASGGILRFSGIDTGSPFAGNSSGVGTASNTAISSSVAAAPANAVVIRFFGADKYSATATAANLVYRAGGAAAGGSNTDWMSLAADDVQANAGATGDATASIPGNSNWVAQTIVLRPASTHPLTIARTGAGTGTVTSSPSAINCPSTCSANLTANTSVTLTASAAPDSTFAGWSGDGTDNADGTRTVTMSAARSVTATFKANQTIAFGGLSKRTYGDADFAVSATASSGLTVTFSSRTLEVCTLSGTTVHIVSQGTCTIRASQAGDDNYNPATIADQSFAVDGKSLTVTFTAADKTFDGTNTATVSNCVASGQVGSDDVTCSVGDGTFASSNASATPQTVSATATLGGAAAGSYVITNPVTTTARISKAEPTVLVSGGPFTYDGSAHSASGVAAGVGGAVDGTFSFTYNGSPTAPADANTYAVAASFTSSDPNYTDATGSGSIAINQASSTTVVTVSDATFDGNPHGGTAAVTGAGLSTTATVHYTGRNATNYADSITAPSAAGDYTAGATFDGDANHTGSSDSQPFSISKASSVTVITVSDATYDATPHGGTVAVTGAGGLSTTAQLRYIGRNATTYDSTAAPTAAGEYTATATFDGDRSHTGSTDSKDFTISRRAATIKAEDAHKTYGTAADPILTVTPSGFEPGDLGADKIAFGATRSAGETAGTYVITPAASDNGTGLLANYTVTATDGTFTIDKAASTVAVTCPAGVTYNGAAQTPCSATVTGAGSLSETLTVTYTDNTNAGTAHAGASFAGDANHDGSSDTKDFDIARAPVTATAGSGSATYDATAKTPGACVVTGTYTGDLTCANTPASVGPAAGTTTITAAVSGTGLDNFLVTAENGSYTIGKATPTVTVAPVTATFDGHAHPTTGAVTGVGGADLGAAAISYSSGSAPVNAGSYIATGAFAGDANYNPASSTAPIEIGKATAAVTVVPVTTTFDGHAHPTTGTVAGVGGANLGAAAISYSSGSAPVNAGSYIATGTFAGDGNYNPASSTAPIEIGKAAPTVTFAAAPGATYLGANFTVSASTTNTDSTNLGYSVASGPCALVSGATFSSSGAGTCVVKASGAETTNFLSAANVQEVTIAKATPTVTWSKPADIVYGTALSSAQLNATASVSGTFTYTPSIGTVLNVGTKQLTVHFVPTDTNNYNTPNDTTVYVNVRYGWNGYLQPINDTAHQVGLTQSKFKLGQTIPAKFNITNAAGTAVQQTQNPTFARSENLGACDAATTSETIDAVSADTLPQYVWDGSQYHYNWATRGLSSGRYRIFANLADGTSPWVDICLTK